MGRRRERRGDTWNAKGDRVVSNAEPTGRMDGGQAEGAATGPVYATLSVIVPVYNERNTVAEVIRRIRAVDIPLTVDVIVVNDGSSDGTDKVLAAIEDSTIKVMNHSVNQGKGAAIRTGLAEVRGDLVLIQDADLEYDPDDWPKLLEPILKGKGRLRQSIHRRADEYVAFALDRQPCSVPGDQCALFIHALGHGDLLQAL